MIKVLSIGNSFSVNAHTYLQQIADAGGVYMLIGNLYIGGCSLETHWNNAVSDAQAYEYFKTGMPMRIASIKEALLEEKWDYVTFQQVSGNSGLIDTYFPYLTDLADYVRKYAPTAKHVMHQTWAYQSGCDWGGFANYGYDQKRMFTALKDAYSRAAEIMNIDMIIPSGEAFQRARATELGDTMCCEDKAHAGENGCYLAGAVWFEMLTGKSILDNSFAPDGISPDELAVLKKCAHDTVKEYRVV